MTEQSIRDDIRTAYIRPADIFGGYGAEHRAELFDAWERRIRAEAWDEGFDEASDDIGRSQMMRDLGESNNPYRKELDND